MSITPFRIRERLKKMLGLGPTGESDADKPAPPPRPKVTLTVVDEAGQEQTFDGKAGDTPLYISGNMARPIGSGCNDSSCATCRIEVLEGAENLSPQDARERATLEANGHDADTLRLGCRTEILQGSVKVKAYEFLEI
jgi:ferredoxin